MKTIVVTGGVATGKSTFCELWLPRRAPGGDEGEGGRMRNGAAFFDADAAVHQLLTSPEVVRTVVDEFGARVASEEGTVDRGRLRELVFGDPSLRERLERILHPAVLQRCRDAIGASSKAGVRFFLADIPLYYEAEDFDIQADLVTVVATDPETQRRRLTDRSGLGDAMVEQMINAQMPVLEKASRADVVVWNTGSRSNLKRQVDLFDYRLLDS